MLAPAGALALLLKSKVSGSTWVEMMFTVNTAGTGGGADTVAAMVFDTVATRLLLSATDSVTW
jgi:hypothetical protein